MKQTAVRYHDFSYGHRVFGHEGACRRVHGHNGRVYFFCSADELDAIGRVIDFSEIKTRMCAWIEENWDHKFLVWENDPIANQLLLIDNTVVKVPFNPTAENLGRYLLTIIGPQQFENTGVVLDKVQFEETRKCSVIIEK